MVRRAIHQFKYLGCRSLAGPLAQLVAEVGAPHAGGMQAVTWVPASPERRRRTGVDHGRLLAEPAARRLGVPPVPLLRRIRRVAPQMGLSPSERRRNLQGAFAALHPVPATVLVVDDVFTTGSTASEVATVLKSAGAGRVVVLGVARSYAPESLVRDH